MMLVDQITFLDPRNGHYVRIDVVMEDQPKFRIITSSGQEIRLTFDAARALHGALGRLLDGR